MKLISKTEDRAALNCEMIIVPLFQEEIKGKGSQKKYSFDALPNNFKVLIEKNKGKELYKPSLGATYPLTDSTGTSVIIMGMGKEDELNVEKLRRAIAKVARAEKEKYSTISFLFSQMEQLKDFETVAAAIAEAVALSDYSFDKYKSSAKNDKKIETKFVFLSKGKKVQSAIQKVIKKTEIVVSSVFLARDFVNEAPNILNSETFAKRVVDDSKKLVGVKTTVLNKAKLQAEKMGMFLSVNAGSAYEPRLVHLQYSPKKVNGKTKHIALVGKGLTFDTGGYNLKPSGSINGMKYDMAGAATVYAAFRAAVLLGANIKISCFLGMTDNAINEKATKPDSVVIARNKKSVEILNTDAEGRLVLGDVLDYACDYKPDVIIDAATLTGAVLVALGSEICGLVSNNQKLADELLSHAKSNDEYMWQLPLIEEFTNDIKSDVADLKNIGGSRFGGSSKAGAFLKEFVKNDIAWAHLDIAGVASTQSHLPYCPGKGASGLMVRTLVSYLTEI